MWLVLQQKEPDDFVLATGVTTTIRDFCKMAFSEVGIDIEWKGQEVNEKGIDRSTGKVIIEVDPRYFRPTEVDLLLGDSTKSRTKLGWKPKYDLPMLVKEMVREDLKEAKKEKFLRSEGYEVLNPQE
jgi:GDPmannose 4,6-dehydratase